MINDGEVAEVDFAIGSDVPWAALTANPWMALVSGEVVMGAGGSR